MARSEKLTFTGALGNELAARLDLPESGVATRYALFAHCFTCSKDIHAARRVAAALTEHGFGVLRFDFTGLGGSGGDFANTDFSSNVEDLCAALAFMEQRGMAVRLLIGHSLGGAAVLQATARAPSIEGVVTIGAPSDVSHVLGNFETDLDAIETRGEAQVTLGGRQFAIRKSFIDDAREQKLLETVRGLRRPLLIMHSPTDDTVDVENARALYEAAFHPKSFIGLDGASHLLDDPADAEFVAAMIGAWAARYIGDHGQIHFPKVQPGRVVAAETGGGKFQLAINADGHTMLADEPEDYGGLNSGPSPYDYLSVGLAACTAMTIRLYVERKGWPIGKVSVAVEHDKIHVKDCEECAEKGLTGRIDRFRRFISIEDGAPADQHDSILAIADKCPVHKTLEAASHIETSLADD